MYVACDHVKSYQNTVSCMPMSNGMCLTRIKSNVKSCAHVRNSKQNIVAIQKSVIENML